MATIFLLRIVVTTAGIGKLLFVLLIGCVCSDVLCKSQWVCMTSVNRQECIRVNFTIATASSSELVLLNDCVCPGYEVTYECTVCGGIATVWTGSLFDCTGDKILLRHSEFETGSASGECNNQVVTGRSIGVTVVNDNRCFSSQLNVFVNHEMNNETVTCLYFSGITETLIGTLSLMITKESALPPSNIHLTEINPTDLTISWTPSLHNCPPINYIISLCEDCGINCPSTTVNTNVTCNITSIDGKTCTLFIRTEEFGNIVGNKSEALQVTLKTPESPAFKSVIYSSQDGIGVINILFYDISPFNISDGIDGSANSYTITFSDSLSDVHCGSALVPASSCGHGVCYYSFETNLSRCAHSTSVNVVVFSTKVLGNGPQSKSFSISLSIDNSGSMYSEVPTLLISIGSTSLFLLAVSYTIFTLVIILLIRSKVKVQRELKQARDTINENPSVTYEEIALNVHTEENVSYGRVR